MIDDSTFERDLRVMLAARDPGPPPTSVAVVVRERLARDRDPGRLGRLGRFGRRAVATAGAVAVVAIVILASTGIRPGGTGSGGTIPSSPAPYELKPGDGIAVNAPVPLMQGVAGLLALGGLLVLAATTVDRRKRVAAALASLAIAWIGLNVGTSDAVGFVSGVSGLEDGRLGPETDGAPSALFVDATGDSAFTMYFTVTNTSRLPLELEGLAAPQPLPPGVVVPPRFVGVAVLPDTSVELATEPRVPFEPVTLAPGGSIDLAVLGMAGQCAISPQDLSQIGRTWLQRIDFVYEQIGRAHV